MDFPSGTNKQEIKEIWPKNQLLREHKKNQNTAPVWYGDVFVAADGVDTCAISTYAVFVSGN